MVRNTEKEKQLNEGEKEVISRQILRKPVKAWPQPAIRKETIRRNEGRACRAKGARARRKTGKNRRTKNNGYFVFGQMQCSRRTKKTKAASWMTWYAIIWLRLNKIRYSYNEFEMLLKFYTKLFLYNFAKIFMSSTP